MRISAAGSGEGQCCHSHHGTVRARMSFRDSLFLCMHHANAMVCMAVSTTTADPCSEKHSIDSRCRSETSESPHAQAQARESRCVAPGRIVLMCLVCLPELAFSDVVDPAQPPQSEYASPTEFGVTPEDVQFTRIASSSTKKEFCKHKAPKCQAGKCKHVRHEALRKGAHAHGDSGWKRGTADGRARCV